ncbi:hypothetical protein A6R68_12176 [Neotoma lepida]|uniref:Uncharacterized protein n=1 Tax=Neotoma lepida TaxID=56216 RepID=A0A1A6H6L0_NEOLE|nr:hypothetical protein A6R68_12176 [Neotoma lepida]
MNPVPLQGSVTKAQSEKEPMSVETNGRVLLWRKPCISMETPVTCVHCRPYT